MVKPEKIEEKIDKIIKNIKLNDTNNIKINKIENNINIIKNYTNVIDDEIYIKQKTNTKNKPENNTENVENEKSSTICGFCKPSIEVCLKFNETSKPACVEVLDKKDPTGCGGHCQINVQHCKLLDYEHGVYQCVNNKNRLVCPRDYFSCGNMCVSIGKRCDGKIDCLNHVDEKDCREYIFKCSLKFNIFYMCIFQHAT